MFVQANFMDIYLQGMRDRSTRSEMKLAREIQVTDWSMAGNLSNRSSGVQILGHICTRLKQRSKLRPFWSPWRVEKFLVTKILAKAR